jgi:hypothetical protein
VLTIGHHSGKTAKVCPMRATDRRGQTKAQSCFGPPN